MQITKNDIFGLAFLAVAGAATYFPPKTIPPYFWEGVTGISSAGLMTLGTGRNAHPRKEDSDTEQ
jgi:hypothetical protein